MTGLNIAFGVQIVAIVSALIAFIGWRIGIF